MSVQTQIDRISAAVSDTIAALTEKGVTVPDGTKVDGLADLIAAIETGGIPVLAYGTITPAENQTDDIYIKTGLDSLPADVRIFIARMPSSAEAPKGSLLYTWNYGNNLQSGKNSVGRYIAGSYNADTSYGIGSVSINEIKLDGSTSGNYGYGLIAGEEYLWVIM